MKKIIVCLFTIFTLCGFITSCVSTNTGNFQKDSHIQADINPFFSLDKATKHIAENLTQKLKEYGENNPYIAISGFKSLDGRDAKLCKRVEYSLKIQFNKNTLVTISPENAQQIKEFNKFQKREKVKTKYSQGHSKQEAYYLVTGFYDVHDRTHNAVKLFVEMINTDTCITRFSCEVWLDLNNKDIAQAAYTYLDKKNTRKKPVSIKAAFSYNSNQGFSAPKILTPGSVLHSGDYYKITVKPDEDCYLYIFQADSAGNFVRLFPMKSFNGKVVDNFNPLTGGQAYSIPGESQSFSLDNNTGTERIYFVALKEPSHALENLNSMLMYSKTRSQSQRQMANQRIKSYFNELRGPGSIENSKNNTPLQIIWGETGQEFSIIDKKFDNFSRDNVRILEFFHQ